MALLLIGLLLVVSVTDGLDRDFLIAAVIAGPFMVLGALAVWLSRRAG